MDHKFYENPTFVNSLLLSCNLGLFILKLIFAFLTNSLALQADAFDSLTDIIMGLAALIGIIYSNKKPNERFPYGYYKIENILSLIISIFIFFTAYNILIQSIKQIFEFFKGFSKAITVSYEIFLFLIISLSISLLLTFYLKMIGKRTKSPIIQSEASEKLYDNFISGSVIISFVSSLFSIYLLDSIIGLIITFFIIKGGYDIFLNSTKTLLDAVIEFEKRNELYRLIEQFTIVERIENLEVRSYGRYIFLEVIISVKKQIHLDQIESLKNAISNKIKTKFPQIFKTNIIAKAQPKKIIKIAVPLTTNKDLDSIISEHFGESSFFAILEFEEVNNLTKLKNYHIVTNKYRNEEKRKGILISEWLLKEKIDIIYLKKKLNKGPKIIFENSFVQLRITKSSSLIEIIKQDFDISNL